MNTDNVNKLYEIWWYDELTENWVCIYSNIDTYEQAIFLMNEEYNNDNDKERYRVYEKSISISKKLLKEI